MSALAEGVLVVYGVVAAAVFIYAVILVSTIEVDEYRGVRDDDDPTQMWSARVALLCWAWPLAIPVGIALLLRFLWRRAR